MRLVRSDAATFRFPRGPLVVYLYNPFSSDLLRRVLERLITGPARELALVYHTPVERSTIEAYTEFELVGEESYGAVYRKSPLRPFKGLPFCS